MATNDGQTVKMQVEFVFSPEGEIIVYTDGSCMGHYGSPGDAGAALGDEFRHRAALQTQER